MNRELVQRIDFSPMRSVIVDSFPCHVYLHKFQQQHHRYGGTQNVAISLTMKTKNVSSTCPFFFLFCSVLFSTRLASYSESSREVSILIWYFFCETLATLLSMAIRGILLVSSICLHIMRNVNLSCSWVHSFLRWFVAHGTLRSSPVSSTWTLRFSQYLCSTVSDGVCWFNRKRG